MALSKEVNHQKERVVLCVLDLSTMEADGAAICTLPPGSVVTGGFMFVHTVYTTTANGIIGDATDDNRYLTATAIGTSSTVTALLVTGFEITSTETDILFTPSAIDATSPAGEIHIVIRYVVHGVGDFTVG